MAVLDGDLYIRIGRSRRRWRGREQCDKALRERRVSLTQRGIGQPRHHGNLRTRHGFSCVDTKGSEAEDAIPVDLNQGL